MAKVARPSSASASLNIHVAAVKRKTPSELREEQLKRKNKALEIVDESPAPLLGSAIEAEIGVKKQELSRNPRYLDIRMDEVFPAKKSRSKMLSGKENVKESIVMEPTRSLKNLSLCSTLASKRKHQQMGPENAASAESMDPGVAKAYQTNSI